jgi:hypothetical protein
MLGCPRLELQVIGRGREGGEVMVLNVVGPMSIWNRNS